MRSTQSHYSITPLAAALILAMSFAMNPSGAQAQTVIDVWKSVSIPPPPQLEPVNVDAARTALLLLDFSTATCNDTRRPTCVRSLPRVARLLAAARSHDVLVVYSVAPNPANDKVPDILAPEGTEPRVRSGVDKFFKTDLDNILTKKGIQTVIVTGTSANGAVIYTASAAALRGFKVIVPVDGYSADTPFAELYTAWHLKNAPASVSSHVVLTTTDLISIR